MSENKSSKRSDLGDALTDSFVMKHIVNIVEKS